MAYDTALESLLLSPNRLSLDGYVIDLGIGLMFFTALSFAVLGRRFEHKRSAAAVSAAIGMALSLGLVAWEVQNGYRLANLGPIAVGFGLVVIAMVIYQAMRRVGGHWAGALTALGASLLIGQVLGLPSLNRWLGDVLAPLGALGLIVAGAAKLAVQSQRVAAHPNGPTAAVWHEPRKGQPIQAKLVPDVEKEPVDEITQQVHAIDDVQRMNDRFRDHLSISQQQAKQLPAQPQLAALLRRQLAALLPESQAVTRRLADLRAKAQMVRLGHLAKIRRLAPQVPRLPPEAARRASQQLKAAYDEAKLDERVTRLDQAAVRAEQKIAAVVAEVNQLLDAGRYDHAAKALHQAEQLGRQVERLLKQIASDEKKVLGLAVKATQQQNTRRDAA